MPVSRKRKIHATKRRRRVHLMSLDRLFDRRIQAAYDTVPPPVLYHYTSWEAAAAILESRVFRVTRHDCTNDKAEIVAADEGILEVVRDLQRLKKGLARVALEELEKNFSRLHVAKVVPIYLACFSSARDDPNQWRDYGRNGAGVCLGLRTGVAEPPDDLGYGASLAKVFYGKTSWSDELRKNLLQICDKAEQIPPTKETLALTLNGLHRIIAFQGITSKDQSWEREHEYRLVALAHKDGDRIPEESFVRPNGERVYFVPLHVRRSDLRIALAEITVGPNQDFMAGMARAEEILKQAGYEPGIDYPEILQGKAILS